MTKVFCAIDTPDLSRAVSLSSVLSNTGCGLKLGLEFFMSNGPVGVQSIRNAYPDIPIFLDLKFHDIPNTVAGALRAVTRLDVQYLNLHAGGGLEMMRAGLDAVHFEADRLGIAAPRLLAVTVLTSIDQASLSGVGVDADIENQVLRLARLTKNAGLAGVVCSAKEIEILRKDLGDDFILMVPGIRPQGSDNQDQKRVMSPVEAINLGASHLVIGRPITEAVDPQIAVADIMSSLA
ncbi:MAG: orotidine-5'-phosphate decarboxylase [Alphaproteobacteria bacterium]|nr:orotidine-5'-phosphate decarboxylase [Alphaproteobacteria bacterium]MCB1551629.1 orotidine-5'-phosphate decarboxylase [Alphaproteobacteria bacterium]MCB9985824.1 orotidine-5'-phosphate decarboxylase [Micavibrio sp.]HPQ50100.1 orotidine-5'-phosphate decarboxylase [Alphaproteobacteria bacterium]